LVICCKWNAAEALHAMRELMKRLKLPVKVRRRFLWA